MKQNTTVKKVKLKRGLSQSQYIAIGFMLMIVVGTLLLMLPISSKTGEWTDPLSAAFTATSACCVTGLIVFDTYTHWSLFGRAVLLILIQIGGLGFMTMGIMFAVLLRRRIGLIARNRMQESISALQLGGIVQLSKRIIKGTALIEGVGALLLAVRFVPRLGFWEGMEYSIFHSISAFCNAGFDLMGKFEPFSSFTAYRDDLYINVVLCALILLGGLGFTVWDDLIVKKFSFARLKLHSKLVLVGLVVFTVGGMFFFWLFERNGILAGVSGVGQLSASLFGAVTPRTAGFNTTATEQMGDACLILTLFLMLVGGNSGSTAGGVKVTSIMVLYLFVIATLNRSQEVEVFGRRITDDIVKKAAVVFTINATLGIVATMIICATQGFDLEDVLFETLSAVNTVGMTRGITQLLNPLSKVIIMLLMYFGRIGSLTFAFSFLKKKNTDIVKCPVEDIIVG